MHIIGGIYREKSIFPDKDVLFGSGGRAAAVLNQLEEKTVLSSFFDESHNKLIRYLAENQWNTEIQQYSVSELICFTYYHGLSTPIIRPTRLSSSDLPKIHVKEDIILQFGMLEGFAQVEGERVVFDPQNPENPKFFDSHGSKAKELAYVLNKNEAYRLSGKNRLEEIANDLLSKPNVKVVIIKAGAYGAYVYTPNGSRIISAYKTDTVWPIGSGDVFAAIFTHYWGSKKICPFLAAKYASRGAAIYCGTQKLKLKEEDLCTEEFMYPELKPSRNPEDTSIYLAGPFFTMSQLWLVEEARAAFINSGFEVFSPYHAVGLGDADQVVPKDLEGIEKSTVLFALCDGLDAGTLFEVGYAVKLGIPVIAFGEQTSDESMKMLRGTNCKVFRDFTSAIYHAQWEALT